jgi:hypothetical protein
MQDMQVGGAWGGDGGEGGVKVQAVWQHTARAGGGGGGGLGGGVCVVGGQGGGVSRCKQDGSTQAGSHGGVV